MSTEADSRGLPSYWYDAQAAGAGEAIGVLEALRRFRSADRTMRLRTQDDMDMNETDLAALRFLIAEEKRGHEVGPTDLAHHLGISTAATTKLIKRLVASGHLERRPHPHDRRAQILHPTPGAHEEVRATLAAMHARMMGVADAFAPEEQQVVVRFLTAMADAVGRTRDAEPAGAETPADAPIETGETPPAP
ncbi:MULTISPECIES: MarR family winged helix-turn-helix transcriptional regulator [unclassified Leifsonia]|uniref:MarR family winged helix-turn-helix transcriptional regulator n=1 Tax=unclassified Leifsonia TaxID=2663824 RepID=UPI0009EB9AF4|nr:MULTISPECIES: MarR family winged helix-turn-helix transcriptional regulator [unclassified Leifsonia]